MNSQYNFTLYKKVLYFMYAINRMLGHDPIMSYSIHRRIIEKFINRENHERA